MARYYPKGSGTNRKKSNDPVTDPGIDKTVTLEENPYSEWLYGEYDENKFKQVSLLLHIPGISNYTNYLLDYRNDTAYMRRYGINWTDIYDPRKLSSSSSYGNMIYGAINFVSDMAKFLYR